MALLRNFLKLSGWRASAPTAHPSQTVQPLAAAGGAIFNGWGDPRLAAYIAGDASVLGDPLRNTAVLRCLDLLSSGLAMLPFNLERKQASGAIDYAVEHPVHDLLRHEPNNWQTAFEFRRLMELTRLTRGDAFALIVRTGKRVSAIQPLEWSRVTVTQREDWSLEYRYQPKVGDARIIPESEILHLRELSLTGVRGLSRTALAGHAIDLALKAQAMQNTIFEKGMVPGGAITHPKRLGDEAYRRLVDGLNDSYGGMENAGRWLVLEEDMKAAPFAQTAVDAQTVEARRLQVEEIARAFGVPRPLLQMDDTSWGSGIEQLAIMFVRFGLSPGMTAWEQAVRRVLLTREEKRIYAPKMDESQLLRGSVKDQGEYFAKALGSGGSQPWLTANEVREMTGYGDHPSGDGLVPVSGQGTGNAQTAAA